jgi:hypothetical protein
MSTEFEVAGKTFRTGTLTAKEQFHIGRRVMPLMNPILTSLKSGGAKDFTDIIAAVSDDLAKIPDDALDYVIDACLASVQIKQGDSWAKVMVNGRLMFHDIDLSQMLQIMWAVLEETFRPFMKGLLGSP